MAVEKVSLALGPENILRNEQKKYPERDLKLLKSVTDGGKYLLLDKSNKKSVFGSGLNYLTEHEFGKENWTGYFEFRYFTLNSEQLEIVESILQKWEHGYDIPVGLKYSLVLRSRKKDLQYLMINVWTNDIDFFDWNTSSSNQINQFGYNENRLPYISHFEPAPIPKQK